MEDNTNQCVVDPTHNIEPIQMAKLMKQQMEQQSRQTLVVKHEIFDRFNVDVNNELNKFVWDQCDNWYKQSGANDTLYPGSLLKFVSEVKNIAKEDDFFFT